MAEVKRAQVTIEEHWPEHAGHKSSSRSARWSTAEGIVCACGDVLGWPDPEHHETLAQYTRRVAKEQVDAASAPGRVQGAFGAYSRPTPEPEDGEPAIALGGGDNAPEPGDYPEPEQQEPEGGPSTKVYPDGDLHGSDVDDPGPEEPEVDWGDPPEDEPEPDTTWRPTLTDEVVPAETVHEVDADRYPDDVDPAIAQARRTTGVHTVTDVELPADEAQASPWAGPGETIGAVAPPEGDDGAADVLPPWEGVDGPPEEELTPEEAAAASAEGKARAEELISNPEVGREMVPYRGTPIMPTETEDLDPLSGRLAPLDPTLPYTPADVELKIVEILRQLENSELFLRQQLARLHMATHNLDFRYNLAIRQSNQRAADQRKADAWIATEKERKEATEAEMLVRALRDSQHNLRSQLSGFQSVARSLAVSMVNALDGRERPTQAVADRLPPEPSPWDR